MAFPETRLTLIQRIASGGAEQDWNQFFEDYWRPVFRFASRWGRLNDQDAEDITSSTFEVLLRNRLLARWVSERSAKLRTLLCAIVRNLLSNRGRLQAGRQRLVKNHGGSLDYLSEQAALGCGHATSDEQDAFYAAWAEELLQTAMEHLLHEFHRGGQGDHFRILYGRICEGLTMPEIAGHLQIKVSAVENHYKLARKRLGESLKQQVRSHVERYCPPLEMAEEFQREWNTLGAFLEKQGSLDELLRRAYADFAPNTLQQHQRQSLTTLIACVKEARR
jgi:RNA polymerase sigma factor (sigma-70 family)